MLYKLLNFQLFFLPFFDYIKIISKGNMKPLVQNYCKLIKLEIYIYKKQVS